MSPLAIPASWRPVLAALQSAGSCLARRGLPVSDGPSLGDPYREPDTPIGELIVANGTAPTFIGDYQSSHAARQFEPTAIRNAKPNGRAARRGAVIVLWTRLPNNHQRDIMEACAFP